MLQFITLPVLGRTYAVDPEKVVWIGEGDATNCATHSWVMVAGAPVPLSVQLPIKELARRLGIKLCECAKGEVWC